MFKAQHKHFLPHDASLTPIKKKKNTTGSALKTYLVANHAEARQIRLQTLVTETISV